MPYIEDIVEPLIRTLTHTGGLPVHQFAGHAANLDFWNAEVAHAFNVIDGYAARFSKLQLGEAHYIQQHGLSGTPTNRAYGVGPPMRRGARDEELTNLRRRLCDAMYHVLNRCYQEDLILESTLDRYAQALDFDVREIKRRLGKSAT